MKNILIELAFLILGSLVFYFTYPSPSWNIAGFCALFAAGIGLGFLSLDLLPLDPEKRTSDLPLTITLIVVAILIFFALAPSVFQLGLTILVGLTAITRLYYIIGRPLVI